MSRTSQAQKQANAIAEKLKKAKGPVNNVIPTPVETLENLLALYPAKAITEQDKSDIEGMWNEIDTEIIDKIIFFDGWNTYDTSEHSLVFLGIDGSLQHIHHSHSPFGNSDNDYIIDEISPKNAKEAIDSIIKTQDDLENDDSEDYF